MHLLLLPADRKSSSGLGLQSYCQNALLLNLCSGSLFRADWPGSVPGAGMPVGKELELLGVVVSLNFGFSLSVTDWCIRRAGDLVHLP